MISTMPSDVPNLNGLDLGKHCPGCGSDRWTDFFVSRNVPVDVGSTWTTKAEAIAAPVADITLAYCFGCGFSWNRTFDNSRIAFKPGYSAGLHHSPLIQSMTDRLVERLVSRFELHSKNIIEIGCGDGYLLKRLCERGGNSGIGIDPTVTSLDSHAAGSGRVRFIRDFYSSRYQDLPCEFLCCQSVLEDIPSPFAFLKDVIAIAPDQSFAGYFEVFNGGRAFEQQETWSIHYEQCNYYSLESLQNLLTRCGFDVLDAGQCPGNDQYIFAEVKPSVVDRSVESLEEASAELPTALSTFAAQHAGNINYWRSTLAAAEAKGQKVVLWGSGGKGVSFLTAVPSNAAIRYVVDINPSRQNTFIPGAAQQIVPPQFLAGYRPDVVILSNAVYEAEIKQQLAGLGLDPVLWHI